MAGKASQRTSARSTCPRRTTKRFHSSELSNQRATLSHRFAVAPDGMISITFGSLDGRPDFRMSGPLRHGTRWFAIR